MIGNTITIDNTKFIFPTNFAGNPDNDRYGDARRKVNIIIPEDLAKELIKIGVNVRQTKPHPGEEENFIPTFFTQVLLKYRDKTGMQMKYLPRVYLVNDRDEEILRTEDDVAELDSIRVKNVKCVLNVRDYGSGKNLYIRVMYVEQDLDDDPFAAVYRRRREEAEFGVRIS